MKTTFVAVLSAASLLGATAILAQTPEPPTPDNPSVKLEDLEVTGTRLRIDVPDGAYPLTVISREQITASGQEFLGEFLQDMPFVAGSPLNTSTGARGEGGGLSRGIASIELRGLGPQRSLVLVNGRRFVPGGNGASGIVDLNMIPMALVERVEIFKSGASVEYGADAVAGVVNIITRTQTDGLEIAVQGKVTAENDGESANVSLVYGEERGDSSFLFGLEYADQKSVGKGDRDFSDRRETFDGPNNTIVFDGSSAPPNGNFRTSLGRLTLRQSANGTSIADFRPWIGDNSDPNTDRYNFNPFEDLQQPSERTSFFAQGRHAFSNQLNLFGEAFYHQRDSRTRLAPLPFFTNREQDVSVSADNAYNPFGETITDARRRLVEAGPRDYIQDNESWRFVLGADGLLGSWFWDASVSRGRNKTDQVQTGDLLDSRLQLALGPSFFDGNGNAVCGTQDNPIAGCVPLNLFGGAGSITPEMLDYVGTDLHDRGYNDQTVFSANIAGNAWALPAGDIAVAFGLEYREESAADIPDLQSQNGNTTGSARALTSGKFDSNEIYTEWGIPLWSGDNGGRLMLDLGGRLVDFSNFGNETLFEVGLHFSPTDNLHVRSAFSQAFRAPNVGELFGGVAQANPIVQDPCTDFTALSATQVERCIAQGVPADGSFTQNGEETPELSGGNPMLDAEKADIFTAGVTWEPDQIPGLYLSLDYYDIEIEDGIAALGANTILEQCLATGSADFCDRINRDATGRIVNVEAQLQNLSTENATGLDLEARYAHDLFGGNLQHRTLLSYVEDRELVAFPGAQPFAGAGEFDEDSFGAIPRWRGQYQMAWYSGSWQAGYNLQWIGALNERGGEVYPGTVNHIGSTIYHDLNAGYIFPSRTTLEIGIDNLGDKQPPFFANADEANTDVSTYRLLGTTYWLRLTQKFW